MAKIDKYTKDFIRKLYIVDSDYSASLLAEKFEISPNTVLNWIKEHRETEWDWDKARELHHQFESMSHISSTQRIQFVQFQMNKIMETFKDEPIDSKSADVLTKLQKLFKEMSSSDEIINALDSLKKFAAFLHKIGEGKLSGDLSQYIELYIQDRLKEKSND